ncbi:MAG: efflux RND transporter periplasmic adaptor subunit [Hyphomicrobiales bacterium]|nr:efflux RND transporter periplasmic adaptor subunit [Hyphomicrobiales bacterium]
MVAQPAQQAVTQYLELTGNTQAINAVDLEARVQGYLESIDYADGAAVPRGKQLFGIEQDIYQAQLDQAQATLTSNQAAEVFARAEYHRQATLSRQDFASQATFQDAQAKFDQATAAVLSAEAAITLAKTNLSYTRVLAPFDGIVSNHLVDVGALVGVSGPTKLATIIQTDPIYVYFTLSEPQVLQLKSRLGKYGVQLRTTGLTDVPVEIGLQSEEGYPHTGRLDYASPQVDVSTGSLTARAIFDNKDRALLPGLFVRVRTPIGRYEKALLTRDDAIGTSQEGRYVLVVGPDNVVAKKVVKLGQREGPLRVIESGLDANDWVVTEGVMRAVPGAKVDPQRPPPQAAADDRQDPAKPGAPEPPAK